MFRLLQTEEVSAALENGKEYEFLLKSGFDAQSGRGKSGIKGKKINDDKW